MAVPGGVAGSARAKGYQLWIALPPEMESIESEAQYLGRPPGRMGPRAFILGHLGEAISNVRAPTTMSYLDIRLKKGERWRYQPPADHTVAWIALHAGKLATPEIVNKGELTVFEESDGALEFAALEDAGFVLGSAVKHPHALALGNYSVHTNQHALERGEARIAEIVVFRNRSDAKTSNVRSYGRWSADRLRSCHSRESQHLSSASCCKRASSLRALTQCRQH